MTASDATTREGLSRKLETLLRRGQYEELRSLLESQRVSYPDDRELRLYQLLLVTRAEGVAAHERKIEGLRYLTELSDSEREIIRQIFILGFEEAQKAGNKGKTWAYQRLARRLVSHQSLESLPVVTPGDARDSERREHTAGDSLEFSATPPSSKSPEKENSRFESSTLLRTGKLSTSEKYSNTSSSSPLAPSSRLGRALRFSKGERKVFQQPAGMPKLRKGGFRTRQKPLGSALLVVAGVTLAAVLANYAPALRNQSRMELAETTHPSNEEAAGSAAVSRPDTENAPATGIPLESVTQPRTAASQTIEHQTVQTTKAAPKDAPIAHNATVNATSKRGNKEQTASATATNRVGAVKTANVAPVSEPREEPAKERPSNQPGGDARGVALGTYQMRVDAQLRQEPRFGSPPGATIKQGTLIRGIELKRDWLKIRVPSDGSSGFIRREFVVPVSATEPR